MFRFRSFAPEPGVVRPQNKETTNHDSNPNPFHYLVGFELKRLSSRYNQLCFLYIVRTQMHFFIDLIIVDWDPRPQHHLAAAFSDIQSSNINQLNPKFSQSPIPWNLEILKFHLVSPHFPQEISEFSSPSPNREAPCPPWAAWPPQPSALWLGGWQSAAVGPGLRWSSQGSPADVFSPGWMFIMMLICTYIYIYTISNEYEIVAVSPCRLPPVPQWPPFCGLKMKPLGYSYLQNEILCPQL